MRSTLAFLSLLALGSAPGPAKRTGPSPVRHLPVPSDLRPRERQTLKARMGQHATSMQNLVRAVVLLDRPTIKLLAERIAGEQTFVQTYGPGPDEAPDLPRSVAEEGGAFVAAVRELAFVAATGTSDSVLADRFAALTRTCVSCHSDYLRGPRMRNPIDTEPLDPDPLQPDEQTKP